MQFDVDRNEQATEEKKITANQNPSVPNTLADEKEKQCSLQSHKKHTLIMGVGFNF